MKTNTPPNVLDLARWIDLQLSTITEGVSAGYTLGNYNSVWIDKGATVFNVSLANGDTVEIDSYNFNTAEEIATAIISTLNNTPSTMNTMKTATTPVTLSGAEEIVAILSEKQVRTAAEKLLPAKFFDEYFTPERANIALLRQALEDHIFEWDMTAAEIIEAAGATKYAKTQNA